MNLWEIYQLLEFICNKDYSGNIITPERFNSLIKIVNINLFRKKYGLPEQYQPGRPIPLEYVDITLKNMDDLKRFKVALYDISVTNGVLNYPENYAHREEIIYKFVKMINGEEVIFPRPVEIMREFQASERRGNWTKRPTLNYPIGVMRSDGIYIYPETISTVDFFYYRWPVDPEFSYNINDGYITYNSSASIEFEWPKDEMMTLVSMILSYIGINLRETEIVQYAELKKAQGG